MTEWEATSSIEISIAYTLAAVGFSALNIAILSASKLIAIRRFDVNFASKNSVERHLDKVLGWYVKHRESIIKDEAVTVMRVSIREGR